MTRINFFIIILLTSISCNSKYAKDLAKVQVEDLAIVHASKERTSLRAGDSYWENAWTISPDINPDIWYVMPQPNETIKATFITDIDSLSYDVKANEVIDFKVILNNTDTAYTQIKGVGPKAIFNSAYQLENMNKTVIEIPELYELINIVFALTSLSAEDNAHVVRKDIPYHKEVINWFSSYKNHEAVLLSDSILQDQFNMYFGLKMDTYIHEFMEDKIVHKGIYNRIAQNIGEDVIPPKLLSALEDFSKVSNFKAFYKEQLGFYDSQIKYYENDINIAQMQKWLNNNFPKTSYDCFRVIFSPLVDWNQSAAWFNNDGFKEAQAHVNFPYPSEADKKRTAEENKLLDGNILFTEFNHAFINPEAEPYFETQTFKDAFANFDYWVTKESIAAKSYSNPQSLFNEYMNWSLVSIYILDNTTEGNVDEFIKSTEDWQINRRGFKHFRSFNQNLITLYTNRKDGQTVADLYPDIIDWCREFAIEE